MDELRTPAFILVGSQRRLITIANDSNRRVVEGGRQAPGGKGAQAKAMVSKCFPGVWEETGRARTRAVVAASKRSKMSSRGEDGTVCCLEE